MTGCAWRRNALKFTWLAMLACSITAGVTAMAGNANSEPAAAGGYELSLANPTAQQLIGADLADPQTQKFVQMEVTKVTNPLRIPLSFDVHFQPAQGEKISLGSFSLFPPDNPGKFIVATEGKLRTGGTVSVTLVPFQHAAGEEKIRVRLARISFRTD